jgi:hypothetical protein
MTRRPAANRAISPIAAPTPEWAANRTENAMAITRCARRASLVERHGRCDRRNHPRSVAEVSEDGEAAADEQAVVEQVVDCRRYAVLLLAGEAVGVP